jgi:nucleoside-specific outer membrane channel protein Tsx
MKKTILATLLALAAVVAHAQTASINQWDSTNTWFHADGGSENQMWITHHTHNPDGTVGDWVRFDYASPKVFGGLYVYSMKVHFDINCASAKVRETMEVQYDGSGGVVRSLPGDSPWQDIVPDSEIDLVRGLVCAKAGK